jgi:uncharacterized membrane protein
MFYPEFFYSPLWWIFPLVMILGMIAICFFIIRGRMGMMICRRDFYTTDNSNADTTGLAINILNKRYTQGEIDREEYEEKKRTLKQHNRL